MKMQIQHPYVTFETNEVYNNVTVNFRKDGRIVEQIFACLGKNKEKEEKYFVDMTEFLGETLDVEVLPGISEWNHTPEGEITAEQAASRICFVRNEAAYSEAKPYSEPYRPYYHFTAQRGWINDPNGCIYFDGLYHLYYQHCPGSIHSFWDNNHWSHAISRDLVSWQECQPVLRYPHESSGTGFINRETGKVNITSEDRIYESDDGGFSFHLKSRNTAGNGDPKIFWHEESQRYISITLRDICSYEFSSSPDLVHWKHESVIDHFRECPEMCKYRIEGTDTWKWVLNGGDGAYMIGEFDGHVFTPDPIDPDRPDKYVHIMEATRHFSNKYNGIFIDESIPDHLPRYTAYAHQHFANAPDDRHVRMAWFTVNFHTLGMPFTQAMNFAQELSLKQTPLGLRICAQPVKELADYYSDCKTAQGQHPEISFPEGSAFDVTVTCEAGAAIQIAAYTLRYAQEESRIYITHKNGHTFHVPFIDHEGKLQVRVLFDVMMCEFFFGDGEVYFPHPCMEMLHGLHVSIQGNGQIHAAAIKNIFQEVSP